MPGNAAASGILYQERVLWRGLAAPRLPEPYRLIADADKLTELLTGEGPLFAIFENVHKPEYPTDRWLSQQQKVG